MSSKVDSSLATAAASGPQAVSRRATAGAVPFINERGEVRGQ